MSGWVAFWIAVAVFVLCEAFLTSRGIDTALWKFKTPNELSYQRKLMGLPEEPRATPKEPTHDR